MSQSWSHSRLRTLMLCGEAYRREEIEREFAPPTAPIVRGLAVHAVAAESHTRQKARREEQPGLPKSLVLRQALPSLQEAADLAATHFEFARKQTGIAVVDEAEPAPKVIGREKDNAVKLARHYVERVAPWVDPLAVEKKIVVEPPGTDIRISGVIDLVSAEGGPVVHDLKTSDKAPPNNAADESSQLSMYALLWKAETGALPERVSLDYLIVGKAMQPPYRMSLTSKRTEADLEVMVARLNNAIEATRAGAFIANGVGTWFCSPKWCRYWASCPFVRRTQ